MIVDLLIFIFLMMVLVLSGIITTRSISSIFSYLKLGLFATGSLITGIATSTPELAIGIDSAIRGIPELSLGNILGTNVVNLSVIIGIAVLIAGKIDFDKGDIRKETIYPFFTAFLPIILSLDGGLSCVDGVILVMVFIAYFWLVIKKSYFEEDDGVSVGHVQFVKSSILLTLGIAGLLISSWYLVSYASLIAIELVFPYLLSEFYFYPLEPPFQSFPSRPFHCCMAINF